MKLSEELIWRGFANQTTYRDMTKLDGKDPITFYFGVDPSADSMTIGNLAAAMMVLHFIQSGHKAILLVGGATGMIGDPDGKKSERNLQTLEAIERNKNAITAEYRNLFTGKDFEIVDNYDWFKDMGYLDFLRTVGKSVPMSQMLGRDFVQSRLGAEGDGISYAEFSYSLIQGYDFLHLYREKGATLQLCGADQWGNCLAGVDLIRRLDGGEAHVWSTPLVINSATGMKFGKSESGAVWLNPIKTTPTQFYQFWVNCDDGGIDEYLKIYTFLTQDEISRLVAEHAKNPGARVAQLRLAAEVTKLIHGSEATEKAKVVSDILTGKQDIGTADSVLTELRQEIANTTAIVDGSIIEALVKTKLVSSLSEARRLVTANAISINGQKIDRESFTSSDFQYGRLILRRGKAYKDSALVELA